MRISIIYKFLLPVVVVLAGCAFFISYQANKTARQTLLDQASGQVSKIVQHQAQLQKIQASDFSAAGAPAAAKKFQAVYQQIHTNDVIRMKVWDKRETVIFSDDKNLIGKNFGANPELEEALAKGEVQTEITQPGAAENVDERNFPEFMEIYTPITFAGATGAPGVIEVYYQLNGLENSVSGFRANLARTVGGALSGLAVLLALILVLSVIKPIRGLQKATERVAAGDLDTPVSGKSKDELGRLGLSFNKMQAGLKDLQRLKNEFVFVAAHELRAPVTAIKGNIELNEGGYESKDEALKEISIAAQRLNQLVDDLLEIARSDAGKLTLNLTPVNLSQLITENVKLMEATAKEKGSVIEYKHSEGEYKVMADENRLKEVLTNLLSNAIKYGAASGRVTVYHELKDGWITTFVKDNGQGISPEGQKHIFEKFYRTPEAQSSKVIGTGLGLYITKELVERMGGHIGFTSKLGEGTTFYFSFKLQEPGAVSGLAPTA